MDVRLCSVPLIIRVQQIQSITNRLEELNLIIVQLSITSLRLTFNWLKKITKLASIHK